MRNLNWVPAILVVCFLIYDVRLALVKRDDARRAEIVELRASIAQMNAEAGR